MAKIVVSGKRKRAIARAILTEGNGKVRINNKDYSNFQEFEKLSIEEPLRIYEHIIGKPGFDVEIIVRGGGNKGQIEASRLALARA
ncbi:MAG: 30S ribosomal protein S9, partial [Bacteroidales bacterium]